MKTYLVLFVVGVLSLGAFVAKEASMSQNGELREPSAHALFSGKKKARKKGKRRRGNRKKGLQGYWLSNCENLKGGFSQREQISLKGQIYAYRKVLFPKANCKGFPSTIEQHHQFVSVQKLKNDGVMTHQINFMQPDGSTIGSFVGALERNRFLTANTEFLKNRETTEFRSEYRRIQKSQAIPLATNVSLQGKWHTKCLPTKNGTSEREVFELKGNVATYRQLFFKNADCSGLGQVEYQRSNAVSINRLDDSVMTHQVNYLDDRGDVLHSFVLSLTGYRFLKSTIAFLKSRRAEEHGNEFYRIE